MKPKSGRYCSYCLVVFQGSSLHLAHVQPLLCLSKLSWLPGSSPGPRRGAGLHASVPFGDLLFQRRKSRQKVAAQAAGARFSAKSRFMPARALCAYGSTRCYQAMELYG